jgi:Tol biopolymer transport system component
VVAPPERLMKASEDGKSPVVLADETQFQLMYSPRMSPDGKWVAFAAINVPPLNSTLPTPTSTSGGGPFDLLGWLGLAPRNAQAHGLPWDVYLVPSAGGEPIRLTKLDEDQPVPTWLDNSTIAFMGTQGLFKISIDGNGNPQGNPVKLHDGAPHGGLSWRGP